MTKYNCKFCGYSFRRPGLEDKRCPYCNKPEAMDEEVGAEDLIADA